MRLGIIGGGVVGRATARAFIEHVDEVRIYDVVKERATHDIRHTLDTDLIFVCLPTPQRNDSLECNVDHVEAFFKYIKTGIMGTIPELGWAAKNFVLRSTVPIGTTKRLAEKYGLTNLVHSPEFLTARCAVADAQMPARNIIGVPNYGEGETADGQELWEMYRKRFPGVKTYTMSSDESEAVKLFTNGFFATKIAYWNEVRTLADKLDLDWERVMEAVLADGRISHSHTKVPGPDGKYGFGGSCLPKDLASLKYQLLNNGCGLGVVDAVHELNKKFRGRS